MIGGALALSACARGDLAQQCIRQVKPYGGDYHYREGEAVPKVTPGLTGTWPEANAINACIQRKAERQARRQSPAAATRQVASDGKLPLPEGYPLMPGDAALWPSLTLAQQQRAMLFLRNGSTIRSSLEGQ